MRLLCILSLLGSSIAAAQPSPELLALLRRQTDETYAEIKARAVAAGCSILLPDRPEHVNSNRLSASATLVAGRVQVRVSTGEVTWLALAGNLAERRNDDHWKKLFGAMASLTSHRIEAPAQLPIWAEFEAERWGAWRWGFQTRMAFVLAHELGHACLGHLGPSTAPGTDCDPATLGLTQCRNTNQCREAKADEWAVKLIKNSAKQLGVSAEGLLSALMELALIDAASGRTTLEQDDQQTHPVSFCRYSLLSEELDISRLRDDYLERISSIIFCIERDPAIAQAQLEHLGQSDGSICVLRRTGSPIASATAVGFGDSNQELQLVEDSFGVALYGGLESYLAKVKPEKNVSRSGVTASKVFVGDKQFNLGAMTTAQKRLWERLLKAQPGAEPDALRELHR
jgi:hypothetical protein